METGGRLARLFAQSQAEEVVVQSSSSFSWSSDDSSDHVLPVAELCSRQEFGGRTEVGEYLPTGIPIVEDANEGTSGNPSSPPKRKRVRLGVTRKWGPLNVPGYEWVSSEVASYFSRFHDAELLKSFEDIVDVCENKGAVIVAEPPLREENVYVGAEASEYDYFFMYKCIFTDLFFQLPFDEFTMGVLRVLNVAPTQFHPNSWAIIQAFRVVCRHLYITPTPPLLLHYYHTRPSSPVGWQSLYSRTDVVGGALFRGFKSSYKNFKTYYFKCIITRRGEEHFCFEDGTPKFPLHWQHTPRKYDIWPAEDMTPLEQKYLGLINQLPRYLPVRDILMSSQTENPRSEFSSKCSLQF